jgi:hypothetical protein
MVPHPWGGGAVTGIIRLTAYCYYVGGHQIMIPKLVVGVLGAWSAALTALIARPIFSAPVARRAGWLAALFPSLVLWSSVLMKDTDSLVGAQLALLGFLHLRQRFAAASLTVFLAGVGMIVLERPYEVIFIAAAVAASLTMQVDRRLFRNVALLLVLTSILLFVIRRTGAGEQLIGNGDNIVDRLAAIRAGYSQQTVGSAIRPELVDTTTVSGLALWVPIGLVYFLLAPFPFTGRSIISLATTPEMIILYLLVPSFWRGLRAELGRRSKLFMPLFFYLLVSSVGWTMVITNVGTIYRYRAQVLFVVLMLIAADQVRRRQPAQGFSP